MKVNDKSDNLGKAKVENSFIGLEMPAWWRATSKLVTPRLTLYRSVERGSFRAEWHLDLSRSALLFWPFRCLCGEKIYAWHIYSFKQWSDFLLSPTVVNQESLQWSPGSPFTQSERLTRPCSGGPAKFRKRCKEIQKESCAHICLGKICLDREKQV